MSQQICDAEAAQIPIAYQSKLIKSPSNFLFISSNDHYKNLSSLQFRLMLIINSLLLFPSLPILLSFFQVAPICSSGLFFANFFLLQSLLLLDFCDFSSSRKPSHFSREKGRHCANQTPYLVAAHQRGGSINSHF